MKDKLTIISDNLNHNIITELEARKQLLNLLSDSFPFESFDAEDFLNTKGIWNHPYISDREDVGHEVVYFNNVIKYIKVLKFDIKK